MKLRIGLSLIISALIMFLSLYVTVTSVGGNDGMGVLLLLFAVVYPLLSAVLGILSGKNFKKLIFIPILNGMFFLASSWIFLSPFEPSFLIGAVIYIAIGIAFSALSAFIIKKRNKN